MSRGSFCGLDGLWNLRVVNAIVSPAFFTRSRGFGKEKGVDDTNCNHAKYLCVVEYYVGVRLESGVLANRACRLEAVLQFAALGFISAISDT